MSDICHSDPHYTYCLQDLLTVNTPPAPRDFDAFWQSAYQSAVSVAPNPVFTDTGRLVHGWQVHDICYQSTEGQTIGGWMLLPLDRTPTRAFVISHGYGGRQAPDFHLPFDDAALFFPCCRGISRSATSPYSSDPYWHVRHDVDKKDRYILRGCAEDIWLMVSVIEQRFPDLKGKIGYLGISFGGGVGMLALAQEKRIARAHVNVPTFGNHRLRLRIPTTGSGRSLQDFFAEDPYTLIRTLRYFDAANAAERVSIPIHFALALRDAVVTPPGQFAIYNQVRSEKRLFVLEAGHEPYPNQDQQSQQLLAELADFFAVL